MNENLQSFRNDLKELKVELSSRQEEQFLIYYEMLIEKNKVMNLTSITEFDEVMKKHFIDSLCFVKAFPDVMSKMSSEDGICLIDIGTGAGFPGIPLKIAFPQIKITLLDSLNKRVQFLQELIRKLELDEIEALHGRAEDYAKPELMREKFDICVSRAVANLSVLAEYCIPYVKTGGKFISYKSEKSAEEMKNADHAIQLLGGKIADQINYVLPNSDIYRSLCVIDKYENTPAKYPRKAGTALKKPL